MREYIQKKTKQEVTRPNENNINVTTLTWSLNSCICFL